MKKILLLISLAGSTLLLGSSFFKYSTSYISYNLATPQITNNTLVELEDNYSLTIGVRKIARFDYQEKNKFYDGTEESPTDMAFVGAVDGWEYLMNVSSKRNNGLEFTDSKFWIRNSKDNFVYKFKYYKIDSIDLEFFQGDIRLRYKHNRFNVTAGVALLGHPAFGYDAYAEYDDYWWELAYDYGFEDYRVPTHDLNDNGVIEEYWIWVETDPITLDGYWQYFYEGTNYYWEDANQNHVADSDSEFLKYHMPNIIKEYNEDKIDKMDYQGSVSIVVGLDYNWAKDNFYFHNWTSVMPYSKGLTDFAFVDDLKYEIGLLMGYKFKKFGIFIEGNYLNMFKEQYTISTGINYQFN